MQIAKFVVAKSDKKIIEEKAKFEYDKRMIYLMSKTVNDFISVTLASVYGNKKLNLPTYEDCFSTKEEKEMKQNMKFDNKGLVVNKSSAFDFLIKKKEYMDERKGD